MIAIPDNPVVAKRIIDAADKLRSLSRQQQRIELQVLAKQPGGKTIVGAIIECLGLPAEFAATPEELRLHRHGNIDRS